MWPIHLSSHPNAVERKYRSEPQRRSRLQGGDIHISIYFHQPNHAILYHANKEFYEMMPMQIKSLEHTKIDEYTAASGSFISENPSAAQDTPISKRPNPRTQPKEILPRLNWCSEGCLLPPQSLAPSRSMEMVAWRQLCKFRKPAYRNSCTHMQS